MLEKIIGLFTGGAGAAVGSAVANVTAIAALTPLALWFLKDKDQVAVSLTWGHVALIGALAFVVIKIVHYTRSPGQ